MPFIRDTINSFRFSFLKLSQRGKEHNIFSVIFVLSFPLSFKFQSMAIEIELDQNPAVELSQIGMSETHGEDSPYFAGWKAYDENPYNETTNPSGVIQMGLAENQVRTHMKKFNLFVIFDIKFRFSQMGWRWICLNRCLLIWWKSI